MEEETVSPASKSRWKVRAEWPRAPSAKGPYPVTDVGHFIVPPLFEATAVRVDADNWPPIHMHIAIVGSRPVLYELTVGARLSIEFTGDDQYEFRQAADADASTPTRERPHIQGEDKTEPAPNWTRPVNASLLRELPLGRLAKHAMLGVAMRLGDEQVARQVVPDELRDDAGFYLLGPEETELEDFYGLDFGDEPLWDDHWTEAMQALAKHIERRPVVTRRNRINDELLARVARVYRNALTTGSPPKKAVAAAEHVAESTAGRYVMQARKKGHLGPTQPGKKGELVVADR